MRNSRIPPISPKNWADRHCTHLLLYTFEWSDLNKSISFHESYNVCSETFDFVVVRRLVQQHKVMSCTTHHTLLISSQSKWLPTNSRSFAVLFVQYTCYHSFCVHRTVSSHSRVASATRPVVNHLAVQCNALAIVACSITRHTLTHITSYILYLMQHISIILPMNENKRTLLLNYK